MEVKPKIKMFMIDGNVENLMNGINTEQVPSSHAFSSLVSDYCPEHILRDSLCVYAERKLDFDKLDFSLRFKKPENFRAVSSLEELIRQGEKFGTIYADPPWRYSNKGTRSAAEKQYPTLSFEELAAMPIAELTEENAHLHLWTTNAFLHEALHLIEKWGFIYKANFVWVKPGIGLGNYWRNAHEILLLGVKGKLVFENRSLKSWRVIERPNRHSEKPELIRSFIESASPPPYLELFGRRLVKGWTVFGNEFEETLFN